METSGQIFILRFEKTILQLDKGPCLPTDGPWLYTLGIYKWYFRRLRLSVAESKNDGGRLGDFILQPAGNIT